MSDQKEYRVELSAMAVVKGTLYVKAGSVQEARSKALDQTGDVTWSYQGTEDNTIEARVYLHS